MLRSFAYRGPLFLILAPSTGQQVAWVTGIAVWGPSRPDKSCPIFVGGVGKDSPAAKAGVKEGDRLLTVDEVQVTDLQSTSRLRSTIPGSVVIQTLRNGVASYVSIKREKWDEVLRSQGLKDVNSDLVDLNATDAEIEGLRLKSRHLKVPLQTEA